MPSSKKRSQGGGRTANSEPRFQVFRDFGGCNFQLSPRDFDLEVHEDDDEQSDLQMNFVVIQNNVDVADNKTLETRPPIIKLFDAPSVEDGFFFADAAILVDDHLIIGSLRHDEVLGGEHGELWQYELADGFAGISNKPKSVLCSDSTGLDNLRTWRSFAYIDDQIIAATEDKRLWTANYDHAAGIDQIETAVKVKDPDELTQLYPVGTLKIADSYSEDTPFRTGITYAYINKFGPTNIAPVHYFYSNTPVSEWSTDCWLIIQGFAPNFDQQRIVDYGVIAVEFYYTTDNAASLLFAGRTDFFYGGEGGPIKNWQFNWYGYMDSTDAWAIAQLQNYTEGAPVSYLKVIDQRVYMWGADSERLYIGGNPGNYLSVSPGVGGGFVDVEPGTGQEIKVVDKYKTQSGNSIVTMLCDCHNSIKEQRFNLVENNLSLANEQSMKSWQAEQVAGSVGCKSPHGAVVCEDGLYSMSRYGLALTTMTMEYNSQIRTNYVSDAIKPVFVGLTGAQLRKTVLLHADGVLYCAFGRDADTLDNILFCYDIGLKSWWTYTIDVDEPIINMIHVDSMNYPEGIGIITPNHFYLLPLTQAEEGKVDVLIETGELATQQPQQGWCHVTQMELCFDYFVGDITVWIIGYDRFGRLIKTSKHIKHDEKQTDLREYVRIDEKFRDYKMIIKGNAKFRLTHFIAKVYTLSNRMGLVYGFDDNQTFNDQNSKLHPTFHDYNDVRREIIP